MQEGFLVWFYREGIRAVVAVWLRLVQVTFETFSISFLLKTLAQPWKRDVVGAVNPTLQVVLQSFAFNLVSRLVGLVIRCAAIAAGALVTGLVFIAGGVGTLAILLFPFALLPTYHYIQQTTKTLELEPLDQLLKRPEIVFILRHATLEPAQVAVGAQGASVEPERLLKTAQHFAQALKSHAQPSHLLLAYFEMIPELERLLIEHDLLIEELAEIVAWQERLWHRFARVPLLVYPNQIKATVHIGYDWAAGYTPTLNRFAARLGPPADLTEYLAHQSVVQQVLTVLGQARKHNVVLVGEPGVGKATVVRALARQAGDAKKIFSLDVNRLFAATTGGDDFESRLVGLLQDVVHSGDVILYVEEIERLLSQNQPGTANAAAILQPFLDSPAFAVVATTTFKHYHDLIEANPLMAASFERIDVNEPNQYQVKLILEDIAPVFEYRGQVVISYQALREIVNVADRFVSQKRFPEKAIDLVDEIVAAAPPRRVITAVQVDQFMSARTHLPVGMPTKAEKELLLQLETALHQRVVNQEQAIGEIAQALRRVRAGVVAPGKPIGSFLFLGPTGVGKTETAKALAQAYFGSDQHMIRLDMSEYQTPQSSDRLIGLLSAKVSQQPFTVLLLDEVEKAHPNILNLFLQVLDEARLTTAAGQTIDLRNTIIIATSNAGSEYIRETTRNQQPVTSDQLLDYIQRQGTFKPEFLNRFNAVVAFRPLTLPQLVKVVQLMLGRINQTLASQHIGVVLDQAAQQKLAQIGFDPVFGARALERVVREKVEDVVAAKILKDELRKGQTLTITAAQL